jgi:Tol biopolymer transport system component
MTKLKLINTIKRCIALSLGSMLYVSVNCSAAATIERVSVDSNGNEANSYSYQSSISGDGRYVAFRSSASNLVADDTNGKSDIFLHDRQTSTTTRVSVDSNGNQANGYSQYPNISSDGRYVVFLSDASNLVSDDTNGKRDIFIHDTQTSETQLVNLNINESQITDISYSKVQLSANARYLAFQAYTTKVVNGRNTSIHEIFVHDRQTDETKRVSVDSNGNQADKGGSNPTISADGRYVAFESYATNLVDEDTNGIRDIFVHDRQTGETKRVSVDSNGNQGNDYSSYPTLSADGRYVAFISQANNLVSNDINELSDIFIHDIQTNKTELVNVYSGCNRGFDSYQNLSFSSNGRYLGFVAYNNKNYYGGYYIYDRQTEKTSSIFSHEYFDMYMYYDYLSISADSTDIVFASYDSNLISGDTNGTQDIFVKAVDIRNQGVLQFSADKYSVNEKSGSITITVTRTNGSDGAVSVNYATSGGTASRRDFTLVSGTLNWNDGDSSDKTFTIDINNDIVPEENETIKLRLTTNFTESAFICPQNTAEVTIIDASNEDNGNITTIPIDDTPTDTNNTSVTYTPANDNSEKAGDITFNKFMMELYESLTDKPTGKYAILSAPEGSNFTLEVLAGFNDVRFTSATLEALNNMKQLQIVSILPDRATSYYGFKYPICSAAKIGVNNNSMPAFSRVQETFCIPNIKVPSMLNLPDGSNLQLEHECQEIQMDIANTQNGTLKIKQIKKIPTTLCQ